MNDKKKLEEEQPQKPTTKSELVLEVGEASGGVSLQEQVELTWHEVTTDLLDGKYDTVEMATEAVVEALIERCGIPEELREEGQFLMRSMIEAAPELQEVLHELVAQK